MSRSRGGSLSRQTPAQLQAACTQAQPSKQALPACGDAPLPALAPQAMHAQIFCLPLFSRLNGLLSSFHSIVTAKSSPHALTV